MPRKESNTGAISAQAQQDLVSEGIENFELPKSIVTKIAKSAIPDNAKLQKETVLSLLKGSTVFINYLAATAHDVAQSKQHKSISASDVLRALEIIQFGDLVDGFQNELQIYRENAKSDKGKKPSIGKGKEPIPAASNVKGKGKAPPLPPPFTSRPRLVVPAAESTVPDPDENNEGESRLADGSDWDAGDAADKMAVEEEEHRADAASAIGEQEPDEMPVVYEDATNAQVPPAELPSPVPPQWPEEDMEEEEESSGEEISAELDGIHSDRTDQSEPHEI